MKKYSRREHAAFLPKTMTITDDTYFFSARELLSCDNSLFSLFFNVQRKPNSG